MVVFIVTFAKVWAGPHKRTVMIQATATLCRKIATLFLFAI